MLPHRYRDAKLDDLTAFAMVNSMVDSGRGIRIETDLPPMARQARPVGHPVPRGFGESKKSLL